MFNIFKIIRNFNIDLSNKIPISNRLIRYVVHMLILVVVIKILLVPFYMINNDIAYSIENLVSFIFIFEIAYVYLFYEPNLDAYYPN